MSTARDLERKPLGFRDTPALIVIDVMKGFTDPACALGSDADAVVSVCCSLVEQFRARALPIFYSRVVYFDDRQASVFRSIVPALEELCDGSEWNQLDARFSPRSDEVVIIKQWPSVFFATDLEQQLHRKKSEYPSYGWVIYQRVRSGKCGRWAFL